MTVCPLPTAEEIEIEAFERLKPGPGQLCGIVSSGDEEKSTAIIVPSLTLGNSRDEAEQFSARTIDVRNGGENYMNETGMTREAAVALLRRRLIELQQEGKSVCQITAEKDIFCRGFQRDKDEELRHRYAVMIDGARGLSRAELEERANAWQLERQEREGTLLCCDVQYRFYETCRAWDDLSNEELSRSCAEMLGQNVRVTGKTTMVVL